MGKIVKGPSRYSFYSACAMLLLLGSNSHSQEVQPEQLIVYSNRAAREDVDNVFRVKIWQPDQGRFTSHCIDAEGKLLDCDSFLQTLGRLVVNEKDRSRLSLADNSTTFDAVAYLKVPNHNPTVFSSRMNPTGAGKGEQIHLVDTLIAELADRTNNSIQVQEVMYELPAVILSSATKSVLLQLASDDSVMKLKLMDDRNFENLSWPSGTYNFDSLEEYNYGDIYWDNPSLRGQYSAKIAIVEQDFPYEHPEFNLPWTEDDKLYQSSTWFGDEEHATFVNAILFWYLHDLGHGVETIAGLLFNSRPYWVSLSPNPCCDDPSKYMTSLNWLVSKQINVANVSQLVVKLPDDPPAGIELAYDWKSWAHGRPLFVFAAGNDESEEVLQRSWNGVIVGATEQHPSMAPDGFSWRNPDSYYSDRELPDMVSYPCYTLPYLQISPKEQWLYVDSCGTSSSAPGATALAGLIVEKMKLDGYSSQYVETLRAIMYVSGSDSCGPYWKLFFPNTYAFGYWTDCERGTGEIDPDIAVDVVDNQTFDTVYIGSSGYEYTGTPFHVTSETNFRAAIAWSQPVSCDSSGNNCDNVDGQLVHDFDLYLQEATSPSGPWSTPSPLGGGDKLSIRNDSSWELIDTSNLNPLRFYRLRAVLSVNGTFQPTFLGIAWRTY